MPWNGSGTYAPPAASFPEVTGTVIEASRFNATLNDVAAGITASLAKNGENAATANIPMGGFKFTGMGAGSVAGQALVYGQASAFSTSAPLTVTSNTLPQITVDRPGSSVNANVGYTTTSGSLYAGHGAANTFAVGGSNNLSSNPWFSVNANEATFAGPVTLTEAADADARVRVRSTAVGETAFTQTNGGLELVCGAMNTSSKYTPAVKFGCTDSDFTTTNPKFGAAIVGVAKETYSADTKGAMAIVFMTTPLDPGAGGGMVECWELNHNGHLVPSADSTFDIGTSSVRARVVYADDFNGALTGNASTATTLQTARTINGVSFNGSANITVAAAAGTLTGATLAAGVTASSLTSIAAGATIGGVAIVSTTGAQTLTNKTLTSPIINTPSASGDVFGSTYTPTLVEGLNVASSTARLCTFSRVGNTVTVGGHVTVSAVTTGSTNIDVSLPVASNFTTIYQLGGAGATGPTVGSRAVIIYGDVSNNRAVFTWSAGASGAQDITFSFTYQVL